MDAKTFKNDITYSIKTLLKQDNNVSVSSDNLEIEDGKLKLKDKIFCPLEALLLIKQPKLNIYEQTKPLYVKPIHLYTFKGDIMYNLNYSFIVGNIFNIAEEDILQFLTALENRGGNIKNEYNKIGCYIREKFLK